MPIKGYESFETLWHGNEKALFAFEDDRDLVVGDFDRVALGVYDLETNTYDDGLTVPDGVALYLVVRTGADGVAVNTASPPTTIPVEYELDFTIHTGAINPLYAISLAIAAGNETIIPGSAGVMDFTNCSTTDPSHFTGTLEFYAPTATLEDFEDGWPAPSAGLG